MQHIDHAGRKIAVTTADGAIHRFDLAEHATASASKTGAKEAAKGAKVVVYSSEAAGKSVAHFMRKI